MAPDEIRRALKEPEVAKLIEDLNQNLVTLCQVTMAKAQIASNEDQPLDQRQAADQGRLTLHAYFTVCIEGMLWAVRTNRDGGHDNGHLAREMVNLIVQSAALGLDLRNAVQEVREETLGTPN